MFFKIQILIIQHKDFFKIKKIKKKEKKKEIKIKIKNNPPKKISY